MTATIAHVDYEALLKRVNHKPVRIVSLLKTFLQTHTLNFEALQTAHQARNHADIAQLAHAMKGSLGNLCAQTLYEQAQRIEQQALEGSSVDDAVFSKYCHDYLVFQQDCQHFIQTQA